MGLDDFDERVARFLAAGKTGHVAPRWRDKGHPDYSVATTHVWVPGSESLAGLLILQVHKVRLPPKYSFSLVFGGRRILGLDVNPGRGHRNLLRPASVNVTHWQRWPTMDAEPDTREQNFNQWLADYLRKANIVATFKLLSTPQGVQEKFRVIVNDNFNRPKPDDNGSRG